MAGAGAIATAAARAVGAPALVVAAKAAGLRFGSAARAASLDDPVLAPLLAHECATLTPELEWKWAALAPTGDRYDWTAADRVTGFARARGQRLRGHTLLWHRSIPNWATAELASGGEWRIVGDHIRALVGRYRGEVDEWDVVNEPIDLGAGADGLRVSPFLAAFGRDYIARALRDAHAAAPRARLLINEYDLEYAVPEHRARREALLALARSLLARSVPLHGIGIQSHLDPGKGLIDSEGLGRFVAALETLGLGVSITELDVKEQAYDRPVAERDRLVGEHVANFLAAVLPSRAVTSLSCWGLSDRLSWLEVTAADRARFPGAWTDGSSPGLNRGLPFDSDGMAKPMRDVIARALGTRA